MKVYKNFTIGSSSTTSGTTQLNIGATSTTLEVHGLLSINQYGVLQYMNSTASIPQYAIADSDIVIAAGGALQVRNGGSTVGNTLTVYGNITNNGTLDLNPNSGTNYCNLIFTGKFSKSLTSTSTPTLTRLYAITVNEGTTKDSVLNVNIDPTNFSISSGGITLQNGTFRLTTNTAVTVSTGAFTIPTTASLSANGGTLNIATGSASADFSS